LFHKRTTKRSPWRKGWCVGGGGEGAWTFDKKKRGEMGPEAIQEGTGAKWCKSGVNLKSRDVQTKKKGEKVGEGQFPLWWVENRSMRRTTIICPK